MYVPLHGQPEILCRHPVAIVSDGDFINPATKQRHLNAGRACIERISTSSLTALAGLSTTSPAAIWFTSVSGSCRICAMNLFADGQRFFRLQINGGCAPISWQQPFPHSAAESLILGNLVDNRPYIRNAPKQYLERHPAFKLNAVGFLIHQSANILRQWRRN